MLDRDGMIEGLLRFAEISCCEPGTRSTLLRPESSTKHRYSSFRSVQNFADNCNDAISENGRNDSTDVLLYAELSLHPGVKSL